VNPALRFLYHVILCGNARQAIFFTPEDRHRFYELLAERGAKGPSLKLTQGMRHFQT
jgi:hypothetical protein